MDGGVDECPDKRRRGVRCRLELWLEERRDEERMARKLHDARVAAVILADEPETGALQRGAVLGVDAIAAVITLDDAPATVDGRGTTGRIEKDWRGPADERTRERRDHRRSRFRVRFRVVGIGDAGNATRKLEHRVLESTADSEERNPAD